MTSQQVQRRLPHACSLIHDADVNQRLCEEMNRQALHNLGVSVIYSCICRTVLSVEIPLVG